MKLICKSSNKQEMIIREVRFGSALCGIRVVEVQLTFTDFKTILSMQDTEIHRKYLLDYFTKLALRFPPEDLT